MLTCKFSSHLLEQANKLRKLWEACSPLTCSAHTLSPTRMWMHAHTVGLKVNNLLMGEKKKTVGGIFLLALAHSRTHARTWGRAQLSPMKLAKSDCPVREWSTTVVPTLLSARAAAACLAISQDTGLLLVESYTNHLARRQHSNVCHWGKRDRPPCTEEEGMKSIVYTLLLELKPSKKREKNHLVKSELIRQSSTREALGEETSGWSEDVSKQTNPMAGCTHSSPLSVCQWFAPWEAVESHLLSAFP